MEHLGAVVVVAFSPDGRTVLTGSDDNTARLWDIAGGSPFGPTLENRNHVIWINGVALSPDGRTVLTRCDNTAWLWDAVTGRCVGSPLEHKDTILAATFSPDGRTVVAGTDDKSAQLWDAGTGRPIGPTLAHHCAISVLAFSADGKSVFAGGDNKIGQIWDVTHGTPAGPPLEHNDAVISAAFSADKKVVVTGNHDKTARLWDTATGRLIGRPLEHGDRVNAVAFSPDSRTVITGSSDKTARLWDVANAKPIGSTFKHKGVAKAVAFSPDARSVLTASNNAAILWDIVAGTPSDPPMEHSALVEAIAFSPDSKTILTGSYDHTARLWNAATSKPIGPPLNHAHGVISVAFGSDGRSVLTGSEDGTARIWTVPLIPNDLLRISSWVELVTGLNLDSRGLVQVLDNTAWRQRRERVDRVGGPPDMGRAWPHEVILSGLEYMARARACVNLERWGDAESALNKAVLARPFDDEVLLERARFFLARDRPEMADDDFVEAYALGSREAEVFERIAKNAALIVRATAKLPYWGVSLWARRADDHVKAQRWAEAASDFSQLARLEPENVDHLMHRVLSLWASGDLAAFARARFEILDRFEATKDPQKATCASWYAAVAPGLELRAGTMLRLAEFAVKGTHDDNWKPSAVMGFGFALYRTNRFEDAIRRLEEVVQIWKGAIGPDAMAGLAMAHHRLGHREEARLYLEQLRTRRPNTDPGQFWYELQNRLLQNEAEATILYDPIFPIDPFAH